MSLDEQTYDFPPFMKTGELAKITSTSAKFWEEARQSGDGPEFIRASARLCIYPRQSVIDWLNKRRRKSTSDGVIAA